MRDTLLVFGSLAIDEAEIGEVVAMLRSGWIGIGPRVARFEVRSRRSHHVATMSRVLRVSCLPQRVLRVAEATAVEASASRCEVVAQIQAAHRESRGTYGAARIHAELAAQGGRLGRKRVERLMRAAGLHGVSRRKQLRTTVRDATARPAPDLVERQFTATGPDRLWVADISYVPTWAWFLYLAVVLDTWSCRVNKRYESESSEPSTKPGKLQPGGYLTAVWQRQTQTR
jgi:helix-turn-helix protein